MFVVYFTCLLDLTTPDLQVGYRRALDPYPGTEYAMGLHTSWRTNSDIRRRVAKMELGWGLSTPIPWLVNLYLSIWDMPGILGHATLHLFRP